MEGSEVQDGTKSVNVNIGSGLRLAPNSVTCVMPAGDSTSMAVLATVSSIMRALRPFHDTTSIIKCLQTEAALIGGGSISASPC